MGFQIKDLYIVGIYNKPSTDVKLHKKVIKALQEKDKQIVKAERQAALAQSAVQKKAQE